MRNQGKGRGHVGPFRRGPFRTEGLISAPETDPMMLPDLTSRGGPTREISFFPFSYQPLWF